jgi:dihydroorotate dehydrogenase
LSVALLADIGTVALRCLPPETAHGLALGLLRRGLVPGAAAPPPSLAVGLWGLKFSSPLGLAAGFDKDAVALPGLYRLGFSFVEAGTVTPRPQAGNPRPRLFRLAADGALINRMGFNGGGLEGFARNLARARESGRLTGPLGVNIGANRDSEDFVTDYVACLERLAPFADYVTLNLSSPNTPGLRNLQEGEALRRLLGRMAETAAGLEKPLPLLLKLAPELSGAALAESVAAAREFAIAGLILCNTTTARPETLTSPARGEQGGLSGTPLCPPALAMMREVHSLSEGKLPLIGVGGIASAEDAYARIRAGASLIQVYTGFIYRGPRLIGDIHAGLAARLAADGFARIEQAVGTGP